MSNAANTKSTHTATSPNNASHRSSTSSTGSTGESNHVSPTTLPALIRIAPQGFQFTASKHSSGQVSKLRMKNVWSTPVGYKFKTNAPLRYSVKPVLGVMKPGQTIEVFVRCESWVNPQDRFLLQSVALSEAESDKIDSVSWRDLNPRRIAETYIQCSSASPLSLKDQHHDDNSSVSSRTSMSSTRSSSSSHSSSAPSRARPLAPQASAGRKAGGGASSASSAGTTPPGSYPTLFGADKKGSGGSGRSVGGAPTKSVKSSSSSFNNTNTSTHSLWSSLADFRQSLRTLRTFLTVRQYTKLQVVTVSVVCLLLGLLLPFEKLFVALTSPEPKFVRHPGGGVAAAAGAAAAVAGAGGAGAGAGVLPIVSAAPIVTYYQSQEKPLDRKPNAAVLAVVDRRKNADDLAHSLAASAPPAPVILVEPTSDESLNLATQQEPEGSV